MHQNIQKIGDRIKEERDRLGLSQQEASRIAGVRREMWAKYEAGAEPGAKALAAMAASGMDVVYILTGNRTQIISQEMSVRERALLDNYRNTPPSEQQFIEQAAIMASQSNHKKNKQQ